jgi:enoyl-CoA hydratase/carnithine racemase
MITRQKMKSQNSPATETTQIRLVRRSPAYWRVTFDHPPLNIFGPETIPQLNEIITALETDEHVKVVVFDSAVEGFFLTHYDFLARLDDLTGLPPGPTSLQPLPDMLVRLSRAPVVSIALIRGRATGVGSELALASDMRFASREKAILSQWEVGVGLVPGGGPMARLPRLMGRGRALEVLLGADDIRGDLAELYGYVNRSLLTLTGLSMRLRPGLPRSTSGQSLIPSASSALPVCRPMSKSQRRGMRALLRWHDQPRRRGSRR